MNKRSKITWLEVTLLAPVLGLVCLGIFLPNPLKPRPFKLTIAQAQVAPPLAGSFTKLASNSRGIRVVVFIDHEGVTPSWWGDAVNPTDSRVNFTRPGEKDDPLLNGDLGAYTGVSFDKSRNQYTFDSWGEIPNAPDYLRKSLCHVSVQLESAMPPVKKLAAAKASISGRQLQVEQQ